MEKNVCCVAGCRDEFSASSVYCAGQLL